MVRNQDLGRADNHYSFSTKSIILYAHGPVKSTYFGPKNAHGSGTRAYPSVGDPPSLKLRHDTP
jgi:hypothetical protein